MRGLPRLLMMFAPMIFRAVSKYWNKYQAQKQQESYTHEPYNEAEGKLKKDSDTVTNDDLV